MNLLSAWSALFCLGCDELKDEIRALVMHLTVFLNEISVTLMFNMSCMGSFVNVHDRIFEDFQEISG